MLFELKRVVDQGVCCVLPVNRQQEVSCPWFGSISSVPGYGTTCGDSLHVCRIAPSTGAHGQQGWPSFTGGVRYAELDRELKRRICGKEGRAERVDRVKSRGTDFRERWGEPQNWGNERSKGKEHRRADEQSIRHFCDKQWTFSESLISLLICSRLGLTGWVFWIHWVNALNTLVYEEMKHGLSCSATLEKHLKQSTSWALIASSITCGLCLVQLQSEV